MNKKWVSGIELREKTTAAVWGGLDLRQDLGDDEHTQAGNASKTNTSEGRDEVNIVKWFRLFG